MAGESLDLNLLIVFDAIARTRSVTRAGRLLGLSKAAMSRALGRLRAALHDPVLVRSGAEWTLSARALELADRVRELKAQAERVLGPPQPFRPATSSREFRLHATDHVVSLLGAAICRAVGRAAPGVAVRFLPILPDDVPALRDGVDLAIGVFPDLPGDFRTQLLFEDAFACVVRAGHPDVGRRLTLETYLSLKHVLIAPRGRPGGVVDTALAQRGFSRHVSRYLPYYLAGLELIAQADCVLTMSQRLARRHQRRFGLRVLQPPIELPGYKITQVWHPRLDSDPAHAWFRQQVATAARTLRDD
ncbi:MAG TPA: LysR family transcriptional regulator [Polyangia bacterium]|nr:LysR family transcriptional regulator [Polyangia bacterium]